MAIISIANRHLLQKYVVVFRDMSLCSMWLLTSLWMNTVSLPEDDRKVVEENLNG